MLYYLFTVYINKSYITVNCFVLNCYLLSPLNAYGCLKTQQIMVYTFGLTVWRKTEITSGHRKAITHGHKK